MLQGTLAHMVTQTTEDNRYETIDNLVSLGLGHYLVTEAPLYEAPNDCLRKPAESPQQTDAPPLPPPHGSPSASAAHDGAASGPQKDHVFKTHTFAKPTWCDWCVRRNKGMSVLYACSLCGYCRACMRTCVRVCVSVCVRVCVRSCCVRAYAS
eukprot:Opistho-1_new@27836